MSNIYTVMLSNNSGYLESFLDGSSSIVIISAIAVIILKNPISSLIALIFVYGFISIFLMLTGLTFIAFSYLIVYIGAVSILFIFILMLIDIRTSELQINNWNSIPLASSIGIFLNFALTEGLPRINNNIPSLSDISILSPDRMFNVIFSNIKSWDIVCVTSSSWDGNITETSHISAIGNILYTSYNMWLFITSIILLLAMVGAIVITIKNK